MSTRTPLGTTIAIALTILTLGLMLTLPPETANVFSTIAVPLLAWSAAGLNYWALRRLPSTLPDHRLLRLLLPASVLWALGETIWGALFFLTGEPPDPSIADVFWLLGDAVFLYALVSALRWYPQRQTPTLRRVRWGIIFVLLALSLYFVLWPIAQEFTPDAWLESLWALVYPLFDTALLILATTLALHMRRGHLWKPWALIALSVVAASLADLFYAYLDWNDLYYTENTLLSRFTDWLFILDYILYGWGMHELQRSWGWISNHIALATRPIEPPSGFTNTLGLLYVDGKDKVIGYSGLLWQHLAAPPQPEHLLPECWEEPSLRAGLQALLSTLKTKGKLLPMPLSFPTKEGSRITCWISGVAVAPGGNYQGANLLWQAHIPKQLNPFAGLSDEEQGVVRFLARETGVTIPDYRKAMLRYTQAVWQSLLPALQQQFGPFQAEEITRELQATHKETFRISVEGLELTEEAAAEPNFEVLRQRFLAFLRDLYRKMEVLFSRPVLWYEVGRAEGNLDAQTLWIAEELGLRPSAR